jgi:ribonuclease III
VSKIGAEAARGKAAGKTRKLGRLTTRLGHKFQDAALLRCALTHASATRGPGGPPISYERLEFLGDRVLGLIIAKLLFQRFPQEAEGDLARRLAALVRKETLADVAGELALGRYIDFGPGEQEGGGAENPSVLADACEAVIGALYLDGGLTAAERFVVPYWTPYLEAEHVPPQDAKTALQEWAQGRALPLPSYHEIAREGPPHEPLFTVEVRVEGQPPATARGRSKRTAEQAAAECLLAQLDDAADGGMAS